VCEACSGTAGGKCPHGHYRHPRCVHCLSEAIDTALCELSAANPENAIAVLEGATHASH